MTPSHDVERAVWALRAYDTIALATVSAAGPHVAGVFFAPEAQGDHGVRLLVAAHAGSRLHRELTGDPRVAFMCSPGNASRWIQGGGAATVVDDAGERESLCARVVAHAPGAAPYVEGPDVVAVVITVRWLNIAEARDGPRRLLAFDA